MAGSPGVMVTSAAADSVLIDGMQRALQAHKNTVAGFGSHTIAGFGSQALQVFLCMSMRQ